MRDVLWFSQPVKIIELKFGQLFNRPIVNVNCELWIVNAAKCWTGNMKASSWGSVIKILTLRMISCLLGRWSKLNGIFELLPNQTERCAWFVLYYLAFRVIEKSINNFCVYFVFMLPEKEQQRRESIGAGTLNWSQSWWKFWWTYYVTIFWLQSIQ